MSLTCLKSSRSIRSIPSWTVVALRAPPILRQPPLEGGPVGKAGERIDECRALHRTERGRSRSEVNANRTAMQARNENGPAVLRRDPADDGVDERVWCFRPRSGRRGRGRRDVVSMGLGKRLSPVRFAPTGPAGPSLERLPVAARSLRSSPAWSWACSPSWPGRCAARSSGEQSRRSPVVSGCGFSLGLGAPMPGCLPASRRSDHRGPGLPARAVQRVVEPSEWIARQDGVPSCPLTETRSAPAGATIGPNERIAAMQKAGM